MTLDARVRGALAVAAEVTAGTDAAPRVAAITARFAEPLRVAVAGTIKAGKSTLLNALVGEPLARTDASECTRIVTWYRHGRTYGGFVEPRGGELERAPLTRGRDAVDVDLGGRDAGEVVRIVVEWPAPVLERATLIDTPGLDSLSVDVAQRTSDFLAPEDAPVAPVDVVIFLLRHVHVRDLRLLEPFHDVHAGIPAPEHAIAVLSRADEIGAGRLDAMTSAHRAAARLRDEGTVLRLCQDVVPLAGLLAEGASRMTGDDHDGLRALAAQPAQERDTQLASADALAGAGDVQAHLLRRLGLFGVRLAVDLLASGTVTSGPQLTAALRAESGIDALRRLLDGQLAARRDALRARAALRALSTLADALPPDPQQRLARAVEEVEAGAHELVELRLLTALRAGGLPVDDAEREELEHLLAGPDTTPAARVGADAPGDEALRRAYEAVARWRRRAEHPTASPERRALAEAVARSYEGLAATLSSS